MAIDHTRYTIRVQPFADSIGYGVGAATLAAWREGVYNTFSAASRPIRFVGSQSFAGNSSGLAADPDCECISGASIDTTLSPVSTRIQTYSPDVVVMAGGTNDIGAEGHSSSTVLTTISSWLDTVWGYRPYPWFQIVLVDVLRRKDAFDSTVQTVNAGIDAVVAGKSYASHVTRCLTYSVLSDGDYAAADNVHPSDTGYTKLVPVYYSAIQIAVNRAQGTMT